MDNIDHSKVWRNLKVVLFSIPVRFAMHSLFFYLTVPAFFATKFDQPFQSVFFLTLAVWTGGVLVSSFIMIYWRIERKIQHKLNALNADLEELKKRKVAHVALMKVLSGGNSKPIAVAKNRFKGSFGNIVRFIPIVSIIALAAPSTFPICSPLHILAFSVFYVICDNLLSCSIEMLTVRDYRRTAEDRATKSGGLTKMIQEAQEEQDIEFTRLHLAIELNPCVETYLARAKAYSKLKSTVEAVFDFDKVLELEPGNVTAYEGRAEIYQVMNLRSLAHRDLLKALDLSQDNQGATERIVEKLKDYETKSSPTMTLKSTGETLAMTGMMLSGDTTKLDNFKLKEVQQDLQANRQSAAVYHRQAALLFSTKKNDEAIVAINKAIELNDKNAEYFVTRARIQIQLLKLEDGIRDYDKAIELDEKNASAYEERARILLALGKYENVVNDCTHAMTFAKSYQFRFLRGSALLALHREDEAIQDFSEFIEKWEIFIRVWDAALLPIFRSISDVLRVQLKEAYEMRSSAYDQLGDLDKAARDAIKAAKLKERKRWKFFGPRETV